MGEWSIVRFHLNTNKMILNFNLAKIRLSVILQTYLKPYVEPVH